MPFLAKLHMPLLRRLGKVPHEDTCVCSAVLSQALTFWLSTHGVVYCHDRWPRVLFKLFPPDPAAVARLQTNEDQTDEVSASPAAAVLSYDAVSLSIRIAAFEELLLALFDEMKVPLVCLFVCFSA